MVTEPTATVADNTVELYRLLLASKDRPLTFDEARGHLGLTNQEMRQAVELLNEVFDEPFPRGEGVV